MVNRVGLFIIMICLAMSVHAQETTVATQLGVGGADVLDTYLSSVKYKGVEFGFMSEVRRDSKKHNQLTYALTHEGVFGYLHNGVGNAHEYVGHYDFSYAVMRRWNMLDKRLALYVGPMVDAMLGFNYNTRNSSNNPAQGYFSAALGLQGAVTYGVRLFGKDVKLGYELRMPFVGLMFSPNYGQSYYEIFNRGDYDHNIVFYSLSPCQLRQQFTADIAVTPDVSLRLGYLCDIRQAKPNNLKQHHYYNAAIVGIVIRK